MTVAYNLGSSHREMGSRVCTYFPKIWEIEDITEFTDDVRKSAGLLFDWAKEMHIIPSQLTIYLSVDRDHTFFIKLINVREYRQQWEAHYGKKWKFDREL